MFRYDRLNALILESGKRKNYLSQRMGFAGRYLVDAEKQNTNIKGEALQILAEELNTTPEYLTGETDIKEKPLAGGEGLTEIQMMAVEKIRGMSDEELNRLLKMADIMFGEQG